MGMRPTSPTGDQSGFTLLELLLAITLAGVVLNAVYMTFRTGIDTQQRIARVASDTQAWRFFAERLRTDLKNLSAQEDALTGGQDTLTVKLSPVQTVHYEISKLGTETAIRRRVVAQDNETESIVFADIERFTLRYLTTDDWRDEVAEELPRAIEAAVSRAGLTRKIVVAVEIDPYES